MRAKYVWALVSQLSVWAFLSTIVIILFFGDRIGAWILVPGALGFFGGWVSVLMCCERCGVSYFYSKNHGTTFWGLYPKGYHILVPLKPNCPNCGFNRRDAPYP